ncbi:MAG: ADP-ribosylglycohydrolase family protein [Muribaculaceae bacterium]|nr:ADP-ribosylglycohydrolase family protein [Muribaculaceae bacterium]
MEDYVDSSRENLATEVSDITFQDRVRGALLGGAIGDAFGYPLEFIGTYAYIKEKYGESGLTDYDLSYPWLDESQRFQKALFSDDTQMTLYTAEGLLEAERQGTPIVPTVCDAYLIWIGFQEEVAVDRKYDSKLAGIGELNCRRAPGRTCIDSLKAIHEGREVVNNSKGCGSVMRVAPVGIYGATHGWPLAKTASLAGEIAELTHSHPHSTYASAALAVIVQLCLCADYVDRDVFKAIVSESLKTVGEVYGESGIFMKLFRKAIEESVRLFECVPDDLADSEIIEFRIGAGWVAEETLAIAVFSVLRYIDDFDACLVCAVNHGGDSDSSGAVAGNIIGAIVGYDAIPQKYTDSLQLRDLILDRADTLSSKRSCLAKEK